jgi:hypothetical protein
MSLTATIREERGAIVDGEFEAKREFRGSASVLDDEYYRVEGIMPGGASGMAIVGPKEGFLFGWNGDKKKYFLISRFEQPSSHVGWVIDSYFYHIEPYSNGEFQRLVFGIEQLAGHEVNLESVSVAGEGENQVATVRVRIHGTNSKGIDWCKLEIFKFLRNQSWAKIEQVSAFPDPDNKRYGVAIVRCQYEGTADGVPLLKQCVREVGLASFSANEVDRCRNYDPGEVVIHERNSAFIQEFDASRPEMAVFDPSPYVDSIGGLGKRLPTRQIWAIVALVNGIAFLLLGVYFFRRRVKTTQK